MHEGVPTLILSIIREFLDNNYIDRLINKKSNRIIRFPNFFSFMEIS
jgi:hypothetical protein